MRYIMLNTETTGLSPLQGNRIVELSAVEVCNREISRTRRFHKYINPGRPIPDEVVQLNGMTDDKVGEAPSFYEVAREFLGFIKGGTLVIHNAPFDLGFIVNELALDGFSPIDNMPVIDSLILARKRFPEQRVSIDPLCERLDIDRSGRECNNGLLDAELLVEVFLAMTNDVPESSEDVETVRDIMDVAR